MTSGKLYVIMHLQILQIKAEVEAKSANHHAKYRILKEGFIHEQAKNARRFRTEVFF